MGKYSNAMIRLSWTRFAMQGCKSSREAINNLQEIDRFQQNDLQIQVRSSGYIYLLGTAKKKKKLYENERHKNKRFEDLHKDGS